MKAVIFDGGKVVLKLDHPMPSPEGDEALVRVTLAGICNTDLEITKGYMDFKGVLGHEFVGVVQRGVGRGAALAGRRVVGEINIGCGVCGPCLGGFMTHCAGRDVLGILAKDGAMAEYLTLPADNLIEVPDGVSDEEAVFTEPLAAAFEILEQVHIMPTDRVLVMGDGKLGLLCAMALATTSAEVAILGHHESKLSIARARGIRTFTDAGDAGGRIYDIVVEATGSAKGISAALALVKPRGTVVLKSTVAQGAALNLAPVVIDEITVVGSRCGPFEPALRALAAQAVDVRPLIGGVYKIDEAAEAFKAARTRGTIKVILDLRG